MSSTATRAVALLPTAVQDALGKCVSAHQAFEVLDTHAPKLDENTKAVIAVSYISSAGMP